MRGHVDKWPPMTMATRFNAPPSRRAASARLDGPEGAPIAFRSSLTHPRMSIHSALCETEDVVVLGVNAFHADASCALLVDGKLAAAVEEERLTRIKHCAGFPAHSARECLRMAGISRNEIDHVAVSRDPSANL